METRSMAPDISWEERTGSTSEGCAGSMIMDFLVAGSVTR